MNSKGLLFLALSFAALLISACSKQNAEDINSHNTLNSANEISALDYIAHGEAYNREAPIPPQCYTRTEGKYNPCYVCHQSYGADKNRTNMMRDGFQQGSYAFSDIGLNNSWTNLFKDRRADTAAIDDKFILDYINTDNYSPLLERLKADANWQGPLPEIKNLALGAEAFDEHGLAKDGSRWVAFNYKPMPSTFWPTNGSTDDVMIQLDKPFSEIGGEFSRDVYYANLALLELAMSEAEGTSSIPLDENVLQVDINGDGQLSAQVTEVLRREHYLGDASEVALEHMLYPLGTAFLHSVRYVGLRGDDIVASTRMKELRYMKKLAFVPKTRLASAYYGEAKEKHFGKLPQTVDMGDQGLSNGFGWHVLGFIENEKGELRKQHFEEQHFCMGCHSTIGSTIDQTFAFPRKVAGAEGWTYLNLKSIADAANVNEENNAEGEYLTYLRRVGGGDEFRQNEEMLTRWFNAKGEVKAEKVRALPSIYELVIPSRERALQLNKAYYQIVQEQSFLFGRDPVLSPAKNVFSLIDAEIEPLPPELRYQWDIRLRWDALQIKTRPQDIANVLGEKSQQR